MAIEHGAAAVGLVSEMPSGPGVIPEELIREIVAALPPPIASFLLTCSQNVGEIVEQQNLTRVNTIQICDRLEEGSHCQLRDAMPGIALMQVIHVNGPDSVNEAISASQFVDAILLDSGNQSLAVKELGGTGRIHNWDLSKQIRAAVDVPVFLAGGLNSGNVGGAIRKVGPFGVDVCTGVRTNGRLDENKLALFFQGIHNQASTIRE